MPRTTKTIEEVHIDPSKLIPSGCTLLDLACSDHPRGAYMPGTLINPIGDKSAGKSMLAHAGLAECANDKRFDKYRLEYRDVEAGINFDISKLFGAKLRKRLNYNDEMRTIEAFSSEVWKLIDAGDPFMYVLDSFDGLTSDDELKKTKKRVNKKAGEKLAGSYEGVGKTKGLSSMLRQMVNGLKDTGSLLIIISQVRQNMDAGPFEPQMYRTGGQALGHNATHEYWLYKSTTLKKEVRKRSRVIGSVTRPKVTKNRITGKVRDVLFPIYYDYGIDNISACVNFMIAEGFWTKKTKSTSYNTGDFGVEADKAGIIKAIEEGNLEIRMKKAVGAAWLEIEESMKLNRKNRFE
jgi:RecA/RadA recombinase